MELVQSRRSPQLEAQASVPCGTRSIPQKARPRTSTVRPLGTGSVGDTTDCLYPMTNASTVIHYYSGSICGGPHRLPFHSKKQLPCCTRQPVPNIHRIATASLATQAALSKETNKSHTSRAGTKTVVSLLRTSITCIALNAGLLELARLQRHRTAQDERVSHPVLKKKSSKDTSPGDRAPLTVSPETESVHLERSYAAIQPRDATSIIVARGRSCSVALKASRCTKPRTTTPI